MDCQANVNNSTDGFNCVGVCGNYHNVILLRAFVGSQKAETFRWLLHVAFPALIACYKKIRTFIVDGCDALLGELRACCMPSGLFPIANILLCIFHLLINSWDSQFGYALRRATGAAPWFQFFKQALFKVKNCETEQEFLDCKNFVLRVAAGWKCDDFPQTDVIKFIISRLNHPRDWVLCYHKMSLTRGCQATPRVEGEHGHSRLAGVNARCSWALTTSKYEKTLKRRRHKLLKWADKLISRVLARSITNPDKSTLTPAILTHIDGLMLPWMVDTLEVQMLCGRKDTMRCVYTDATSAKHVFAVFFEEDEPNDEMDDVPTAPEQANPATVPEVAPSPEDSSEDELASDSSEAGDQPRKTAREQIVVDDEEEEWTDAMQAELEDVLSNPIAPNTEFFFKKVRTLTLLSDPKNPSKLIIICDCGFAPRIGCACRHTWCFLFTILKAIPRILGDGAGMCIDMCQCLSKPVCCPDCSSQPGYRPFGWEEHDLFSFQDMVNMDIASKVKYHAVLRPDVNANSLFPEEHPQAFHPRISKALFRKFTSFHKHEGTARVPKSGIPETPGDDDANDGDCDGEDATAGPPPPNSKRDRSQRRIVPTFPMVDNLLKGMWQRTDRLSDREIKAQAKSIILTMMQEANEAIMILHPDLAPKRMHRFYSQRDRILGLAAP